MTQCLLCRGTQFRDQLVVTSEMVESFAAATGDRNPIHFNDLDAEDAGFRGAIAHGDLVIALANGVILEHLPNIVLTSRKSEWKRPVLVGSVIDIVVTIEVVIGMDTHNKVIHFEMLFSDQSKKLCAQSWAIAQYSEAV